MSHYCDEVYDIYDEKVRRANKQHKCCACSLPIRAGDYYCYVFVLFDGNKRHYKRCGACQKTHEHLRKLCVDSDSDMWPNEWLGCGQDYEEEWGDKPPDEIAALPLLSDDERGRLLARESAR